MMKKKKESHYYSKSSSTLKRNKKVKIKIEGKKSTIMIFGKGASGAKAAKASGSTPPKPSGSTSPKASLLWDLSAFRPDLNDYLENGDIYEGYISFDNEHLCSESIKIPRVLEVVSHRFVNIR